MKRSSAQSRFATLLIALVFVCGLAPCSGAAPVGEKTIKEAVRKHVEDNAPWPKDRLRVEFFGPMPEVTVSGGQPDVQVRSRAGEHYIGRTSFTVRFSKGDTVVREETVRVRIEVFTDVVVSTRGIMRDTVIGSDDVTVTSKWKDTAATGILTDAAEVIGKKAVMRLNAGTEITRTMLRSAPVVKKGEVVRIVLESGPMVISAVGLCQEDGGKGDLVRVQNMSSKKIIFARVMGTSLVRVDF
jgi:flagella basal body P-ring formation protein FlgA